MLSKNSKKEITITCPCCGYEYLPAEIFIPKAFFGHPDGIERSSNGKIDVYEGSSIDPVEKYVCDNCGCKFEVTAELKFKTRELTEEAFSPVYTSPLPQRISLFEGIADDN